MNPRTALLALGLAAVALFSVGCASPTQAVRLPSQSVAVENKAKARIYVLRPAWIGTAVSMRVEDNGAYIGHTGPKSFLCWERSPGPARLVSKSENSSELNFVAQANSVHYVEQHVLPGILFARTKISQLSPEDGRKWLAKCKPPKVAAAP